MVEKIRNNKTMAGVIGLVVTAVLIVALVLLLSSCGKADNDTADESPAEVTETAQPADKKDGAATAGTSANGATAGSPDKAPVKGNGTSSDNGTSSSDRNKLEYIMNYDDNVEKGVNSANRDFESVINKVGNDISSGVQKGDMSSVATGSQEFMNGVQDYVGSIINTVKP